MHALIVGPRQVGKSTLIHKVLNALDKPVWGFVTKREEALYDETLGYPVYIYQADGPRLQSEDNLIGYCRDRKPEVNTAIFENFAANMQVPPEKGSVILMDELGFLESDATYFQTTVLKHLDGDIPVIAAVKEKSTVFLDQVKKHPNCKCFFINEENREELFEIVLNFLQKQF